MRLWKTTIVIWSDVNPSKVSLEEIAYDAVRGDSYCSKEKHEYITKPEDDPDYDPVLKKWFK